MRLEDYGKALLAAYRVMEPATVIVSLARNMGHGKLSTDVQSFVLAKCIKDKICRKYPPAPVFLRQMLKLLILAAESDGEEVLESLYELHAAYLLTQQDSISEIAGKCYKSYTYAVPMEARRAWLACTVRESEREVAVEVVEELITLRVSLNMLEGATGCCLWPASLFLTEVLLNHPELVSGKKCLELGAGAGMVGVCLARLAAAKIVLTDGDLATLANLRHNLQVNGVKVHGKETLNCNEPSLCSPANGVECRQLLWEIASEKELRTYSANVILGADLIYDPEYIPHLVHVVASLLSFESSMPRNNDGNSIDQVFRTAGDEDGDDAFNLSAAEETATLKEYSITNDCCNTSCTEEKDPKLCQQPRDLRQNGQWQCIAYIASALRNPETLVYFVETARAAQLEITDVTDVMQPLKCFTDIKGFDRTRIRLHRLQKP